ncbi:hypothetical protein Cfor_03409 [Coptotermes formosanus]|uniref:GIY-YIG domain-containing protein n=1 Tax=Coptotermes formosanus TaxID=36987 RepID=A0A6L2QC92_COPFO|nr:hypothetical protein Cfor_03409 [Coptotermes formosanus]
MTFRITNTIHDLKSVFRKTKCGHTQSGSYELTCLTFMRLYVGQTCRTLKQKYQEHVRYINYHNPQSAYALHILQNVHEYEPIDNTMVLHHVKKGIRINYCEQFCFQMYGYNNKLIWEQNTEERNALLQLIYDLQLQHAIT